MLGWEKGKYFACSTTCKFQLCMMIHANSSAPFDDWLAFIIIHLLIGHAGLKYLVLYFEILKLDDEKCLTEGLNISLVCNAIKFVNSEFVNIFRHNE